MDIPVIDIETVVKAILLRNVALEAEVVELRAHLAHYVHPKKDSHKQHSIFP